MKNAFGIILLVIFIFGGGLLFIIGLPIFLTRHNQTFEIEKARQSHGNQLKFTVNRPILGEDITLDLCHKNERWSGSSCAIITFNISFLEWDVKLTKVCTIDNGYCTLELPSVFVNNDAVLKSLEVNFMEVPLQVDKASLFIGKIL